MADELALNATTQAAAIAENPKLKKEFWNESIRRHEGTTDLLKDMEGTEESGAIVAVKTDLAKGQGDTVNFNTVAALGEEGIRGSGGPAGFEENLHTGSFQCIIDKLEHAVSTELLYRKFNVLGPKADRYARQLLGEWLGLRKQNDAFHAWRMSANYRNTIYPNGKGSIDDLTSSDTLNTALVTTLSEHGSTLGVVPGALKYDESGNMIKRFTFIAAKASLTGMKNSSSYQTLLNALTQSIGKDSPALKGGFINLDGTIIRELDVADTDAVGPMGCGLQAKAYLGGAIADTDSAHVIKGGGTVAAGNNTKPMYFRDFPGYDYILRSGQAANPNGSTPRYMMIVNPDMKIGFFKYVTIPGNTITILERLHSVGGTYNKTTVGQVVYGAGEFTAGRIATTHPVGATILPCNAKGVPFAYGVAPGKAGLLRCYGDTPMERTEDNRNYGNFQGIGIRSIYGQASPVDTAGTPRNFILVPHAWCPANLNIPSVADA